MKEQLPWIKERRAPTQQERDDWDDSFGPVCYVGKCDDCVDKGDKADKPVHRIEGDGVAFCKDHWKVVERSFQDAGEFCEPFNPQ